jgi:hypothetical protein
VTADEIKEMWTFSAWRVLSAWAVLSKPRENLSFSQNKTHKSRFRQRFEPPNNRADRSMRGLSGSI